MDQLLAVDETLEPQPLSPQASMDSMDAPSPGRFSFTQVPLPESHHRQPKVPRLDRRPSQSMVPERLLGVAEQLRIIDQTDDAAVIAQLRKKDLTNMTSQIRDIEKTTLELARDEGRDFFRLRSLLRNLTGLLPEDAIKAEMATVPVFDKVAALSEQTSTAMAMAVRLSEQQEQQEQRQAVLSELRKQQAAVEQLTALQRRGGGDGGRVGGGRGGGNGARGGSREIEGGRSGEGRRGGRRYSKPGGRGGGRRSATGVDMPLHASMHPCMPMMGMGGAMAAEYRRGPGEYLGDGGYGDGGYVCGYAQPQLPHLYADMGGGMGAEYGDYLSHGYTRMDLQRSMVMGHLLHPHHATPPTYATPAGMQLYQPLHPSLRPPQQYEPAPAGGFNVRTVGSCSASRPAAVATSFTLSSGPFSTGTPRAAAYPDNRPRLG